MKTIVLAVFSLQGNGAERVVQTLARNINALGGTAHIVIFKDTIDLPLDNGVHIHKFPYRAFRSLPRKIRPKIAAKFFDRFIRKNIGTPDLVLSNLHPVDFILSKSRLPNIHFIMHNNTSQEYALDGAADPRLNRLKQIYSGKNVSASAKASKWTCRRCLGNRSRPAQSITRLNRL